MNKIKEWFSQRKERKATRVVSGKKENAKGENFMADETKEKVEIEDKKVDENPTENAPVEEKKVEEKVEEKPNEEKVEEKTDEIQPEEQPNQVSNAEPQGNGISIDQVVTKDLLEERLSALNSKLEALVNENKGLMDKLTQMTDKYEKQDFGGMQKQGVSERDKIANDSFEEYSRQFM